MTTTDSALLWSPRRRRVFYSLAAALTLGAACVFAATGVTDYLSGGFNEDVFTSGVACALFLGATAMAARDASTRLPASV